jgi:hypothetical protein
VTSIGMIQSATASRATPTVSGIAMSLALSWSKRFVFAGFLFFLCKGLLWLVVLAALSRLR